MAVLNKVILRKFGKLSNYFSEEMNLYHARAFIRHLLSARSAAGHGVHSPFVFDFLTTVVRGKNEVRIIREVESLRREMLADRRVIRVTDLGAGSAVHKGEERRVSEIASTTSLPPRQLTLLSRIAGSIDGVRPDLRSLASTRADWPISNTIKSGKDERREGVGGEVNISGRTEEKDPLSFKEQRTSSQSPDPGYPGIILELGSSLGISTLAMALAAPERRVVSVEGCPALAEIARENLRRHGAANTEILNMEFSEALSLLRNEGTRVSLAFIDGNHRGEALKQYVSEIRTMGEEMIIVADDIHLNRDMYNAWRSLADPSLHVPASRKVPSTAEKMPTVHQAIAPATAEKTPPVQQAIAPATAEKMPPAHPETATATMETSRFGILFRRQSLTPRHYRIRY